MAAPRCHRFAVGVDSSPRPDRYAASASRAPVTSGGELGRGLLRQRDVKRRVYRAHKATRITSGVFGGLFLAFGCGLFGGNAFMGSSPDWPGVVSGLFFIVFGVCIVVPAVRPHVLTIDDAGLHLSRAFGTKHIPWSDVQGFGAAPGGKSSFRTVVILHTDKKVGLGLIGTAIGMSRADAEKFAAELATAQREHNEFATPPFGQPSPQ